ncbi:type IV secretory system conjugative DNA transfer family protein [Methylomagnum ishizawai]|uniref:type IV secretory system conjugative DNA transfer family protein n=1 Tax=Methylomagnum ishizawai TaxID=1760988 RepID=UPI001C827829|nr:hypothetical protein [Methylomagnum ishizawai]
MSRLRFFQKPTLVSLPILLALAVLLVLLRWRWHFLFPPQAPRFPPEQRETRALWHEARQLAATARLSLHPGPWAAETARCLCGDAGLDPEGDLAEALETLAGELLEASGLYGFPPDAALDYALSDLAEGLALREELRDKILLLREAQRHEATVRDYVADILAGLLASVEAPPSERGQGAFRVPLLSCVEDAPALVEGIVGRTLDDAIRHTSLFRGLRDRLMDNLDAVSDELTPREYARKKKLDPAETLETYLKGTPFLPAFAASLPFSIPQSARFEHTHVVAGSGHGKTQTLQHLILADLDRARRERFGFALIDSQGDLIARLTRLSLFDPEGGELAGRLTIIDPNDLKHPAGLNLFDYDLDRFQGFSEVEREKIFHGVLELYAYIFSSLLGAELTQKQGVVFTNLARAMLVMPDPTIYTFYDFVEDGTKFKPYIEKLDGIPRRFFETQFFTNAYSQTRQQIVTRLLGVLGNPAFERMFAHPKNNVDMFGAMQAGQVVVVNTAKDLLKSEGSSILGRFFVALIVQATLARAAVPERERTPYHVYIDEAQEYFDRKTDELLNQGRKFRVGVTLAHQHLNQLDTELRATLKASTSVKLVGGVNHADALALAQEMNCSAEFVQSMRKRERQGHTEFACYVRHHTPQPVRLAVPLGAMERLPRMDAEAHARLIEDNRARVARRPELPPPERPEEASGGDGATVDVNIGTEAESQARPATEAGPEPTGTTARPRRYSPKTPRSGPKPPPQEPLRGEDGHIRPKDDLDFYVS